VSFCLYVTLSLFLTLPHFSTSISQLSTIFSFFLPLSLSLSLSLSFSFSPYISPFSALSLFIFLPISLSLLIHKLSPLSLFLFPKPLFLSPLSLSLYLYQSLSLYYSPFKFVFLSPPSLSLSLSASSHLSHVSFNTLSLSVYNFSFFSHLFSHTHTHSLLPQSQLKNDTHSQRIARGGRDVGMGPKYCLTIVLKVKIEKKQGLEFFFTATPEN
jgi:hypothetical protein